MSSFTVPSGQFTIASEDQSNVIHIEDTLMEKDDVFLSLLHFGPPHNKIVSCVHSGKITIWCSDTKQRLQTIENHSQHVSDLIKLNEDIFLSCSTDRKVLSFSISSHDQIKEFEMDDAVNEILGLTDDLFICRCESLLYIWSYSEEKMIEGFNVGFLQYPGIHYLKNSKNYPNCLYVSTNDSKDTIRLVNYKESKVVKEFKAHDEPINSFCVYQNSRNEEILIACSCYRGIYFYNTSNPKFDTNILFKDLDVESMRVDEFSRSYHEDIFSSLCLNDQYLVVGGGDGDIGLFEIIEHKNALKRIVKKRIFGQCVCCIAHFSNSDKKKPRIMTCGADGRIMIIRLENLVLKEKKSSEEMRDLEERIQFLLCSPNQYMFEEMNMIKFRVRENEFSAPKLLVRIL